MGFLEDILGQAVGKSTTENAVPQGNLTKPLLLALLALWASGALSGKKDTAPAGAPAGGSSDNPLGDLLGGLLGGGAAPGAPRGNAMAPGDNPLGGLLGGGALAGGLLGGLGSLLNQFQQSGHGNAFDSWIGTGQNQPATASQMRVAFSPEVIEQISQQTGMDPHDVLEHLAQGLPDLVDKLTPNGSIPSERDLADDDGSPLSELSRMSRL